jgi:UDP-N-acetylmuramoyl-tripeptide--D-alanyl-D-alanine ligase
MTAAALWTSEQIAAATGGLSAGGPFSASGIAIDSRTVTPGDLFVALAGQRDGHEFLDQAFVAGAAGALTERPARGPCVVVPDCLDALRRLGVAARDRASAARRGAVTGSVGKTGVTQAILAGISLAGPAHGPAHSFNNHIGVPLTLARMPPTTRRAVFEIGMNHAGEIEPLARLVRPLAVAITNVEAVHVENFADGEAGVARAKAEIFAGLEPGGIAVLPFDSPWFEALANEARRRGAKVRTFGEGEGADARLTLFARHQGGAEVQGTVDGETLTFPIRQAGAHWGGMSLCVLLMLDALGVDRALSLAALADFEPLAGRGAERSIAITGGVFTLVDESYNANPVSMRAALATLAARRGGGRKVVVLTDMLELGEGAPEAHSALAAAIEAARIDKVWCAGPLMEGLWKALPPGRRAGWAPCAGALASEVAAAIAPGDVVMVKGSKGSKAWAIRDVLVAEDVGARA